MVKVKEENSNKKTIFSFIEHWQSYSPRKETCPHSQHLEWHPLQATYKIDIKDLRYQELNSIFPNRQKIVHILHIPRDLTKQASKSYAYQT